MKHFGLFLLAAAASTAHAAYEISIESSCFNVTDYNFQGLDRPEGVWEGQYCVSMKAANELTVTWDNSGADWRRIYEAKAWAGANIADMPTLGDGSADVASFPAGEIPCTETGSYSTTLTLDTATDACPSGGSIYLAAYAKYADPCSPSTGLPFPNSDFPAWVQDTTNFMESSELKYTYVSVPITCTEVPDTRTPPIMMTPPKPPKSSVFGDPHFETWTGDKFDYHGECDLVLMDNPNFMDGLGLKLHIRTTRISYYSYIERIALQVGEDVLEFANDVDKFLINGKQVEPNRKYHKTLLSGFLVRRGDKKSISVRLSKGNYKRGSPRIDFHARTTGFPAITVNSEGSDIFNGSLGLLGDYTTGKRMARDGKTVMGDEDPTNYALEWQVRDTEPLLFKEARAPQFPVQCVPPTKMMGKRLGDSHMKKEAEKVCANWGEEKDACIFDVMATRDIKVAKDAIKMA